jgi:23S rRNA pseudouridine2604 synthase
MPEPGGEGVRLAKRVAALVPCSRSEAERYIEGGWVTVDGTVVEEPPFRVTEAQQVVIDKNATLLALMPVTLLLHKPPGYEALGGTATTQNPHVARSRGAPAALQLLTAASHSRDDTTGTRVLRRHFVNLVCDTPLPTEASGLVVYTQDTRIARKLAEDAETLEQECIVEVAGQIIEGGLARLCHGLTFNGRPLPPIKVSWQNETRLRFALKGIRPGQIPSMCEAVGLRVLSLKRIRIGRVPMSQLAVGQWRYLPGHERF